MVADAGEQRGHHHPGVDAVLHQVLHGLQPRLRARGARLGQLPDLFVHGADAEVDADLGDLAELLQQVNVAAHQDAFGGDAGRVGEVNENLQYAAHELIFGFGGFVGVGGGSDSNTLSRQLGLQFLAQHLGGVDLGEDPLLEVAPASMPQYSWVGLA